MQYLNGSDLRTQLAAVAVETRPIRQLVKASDVAKKLAVSISWVIQHFSTPASENGEVHLKDVTAGQKHDDVLGQTEGTELVTSAG
jgi:hypothetical protein